MTTCLGNRRTLADNKWYIKGSSGLYLHITHYLTYIKKLVCNMSPDACSLEGTTNGHCG